MSEGNKTGDKSGESLANEVRCKKAAGNTRHEGNVENTGGTVDKGEKEGQCEEGDTAVPGEGEQEEGKKTNAKDDVDGHLLKELL